MFRPAKVLAGPDGPPLNKTLLLVYFEWSGLDPVSPCFGLGLDPVSPCLGLGLDPSKSWSCIDTLVLVMTWSRVRWS